MLLCCISYSTGCDISQDICLYEVRMKSHSPQLVSYVNLIKILCLFFRTGAEFWNCAVRLK
jgi:hypothetical protein